MILSRTLAKRRIAQNMRPGFFAAWTPVAFDLTAIFAVLWLLWNSAMAALGDAGLPVIFAFFFVVYFIPIQITVIVSSMWAARSRWNDKDDGR